LERLETGSVTIQPTQDFSDISRGAGTSYANVSLLELGQLRARAEWQTRVSIWKQEGKKGRKGGMSGGKGGEDKGARERETTHQKRRLRRYPKSITEAGGASGTGEAYKFQRREDEVLQGQRFNYQHCVQVRRESTRTRILGKY
jgi:hypothetical protein